MRKCCILWSKSCSWRWVQQLPEPTISWRRRSGARKISRFSAVSFPYDNGIPSHDTLCDVFAAIDPELFKSCFLNWVEDLRDGAPEIIAIDGKTSRRSHDRGKGRKPLHMVSAWATNQRIVLGQEATEEKSNEITAIPRLLKSLDLQGAVVTIDAMGTQTRQCYT
jgi:hypothetical protein